MGMSGFHIAGGLSFCLTALATWPRFSQLRLLALLQSTAWSARSGGSLEGLPLRVTHAKPATAMTELEIEVQDGDITVTLPGTSYTVTYYKPKNSPQLLAKRIASKDDPGVALTLSEFLARPWQAANNKARGLGWIV